MALSSAAIRRDSVFFLRFPFLSQVQVFWCEIIIIIIIIIIIRKHIIVCKQTIIIQQKWLTETI